MSHMYEGTKSFGSHVFVDVPMTYYYPCAISTPIMIDTDFLAEKSTSVFLD